MALPLMIAKQFGKGKGKPPYTDKPAKPAKKKPVKK